MTIGEKISLTALVVTAVATAILAIATAVLALATNRLVQENKKVAAENNRLIAAAETQAMASMDTIEEIRRDRELGYRPYLTFEITRSTPDQMVTFAATATPGIVQVPVQTVSDTVHVVNYGRGPAISAVFCEVLAASWRRTLVFDLSPEGTADMEVTPHSATTQPTGDLLGAQDHLGRWVAIFCEDQFGNRFRFRPRVADPDVWRPGEPTSQWSHWFAQQKFLD